MLTQLRQSQLQYTLLYSFGMCTALCLQAFGSGYADVQLQSRVVLTPKSRLGLDSCEEGGSVTQGQLLSLLPPSLRIPDA